MWFWELDFFLRRFLEQINTMLSIFSKSHPIKDNPQSLLPAPAISTSTTKRRRIRPAFLLFIFAIAVFLFWDFEFGDKLEKGLKMAESVVELDDEMWKYNVDYGVHVFYYS